MRYLQEVKSGFRGRSVYRSTFASRILSNRTTHCIGGERRACCAPRNQSLHKFSGDCQLATLRIINDFCGAFWTIWPGTLRAATLTSRKSGT